MFQFLGFRSARGVFARLLSVLFLLCLSVVTMAADLYVSPNGSDSNSGSQSSPFRTIKRADSAASPGTTVHVAPGNYGGGFETNKSGTSTARIRFVSDVKWGAKIVGSGGSNAEAAWFSRGGYVDIVGFEVDGRSGAGLSWSTGIYAAGTNAMVRDNKVHDICIDPATLDYVENNSIGGAGIMVDGYYRGVNSSAIGNIVYNIGPSYRDSDLVHGIYQSTSGSVVNNVVYNITGDGISNWHDVHHVNIVNNTVYKARGQGILVGAGDKGAYGEAISSAAGDNFKVINNIVVGSKKYGIQEYGRTGYNNIFQNNLLYDNGYGNIVLQNGKQSNTYQSSPGFLSASTGNFRLAPGAYAINRGTSSYAPTTDNDGVARPQGGAIDIGAFELASTSSAASGVKSLIARHSGKCVDIEAVSTANGAKAQQWACTGGANQKFDVVSMGNNQYSLKARHSGKCLDVTSVSTSNGARIQQWACTGGNNQKFTLKDMGGGYYSFVAVHSGKCLDVTSVSTSNGAAIQQWSCTGGNNQQFRLN